MRESESFDSIRSFFFGEESRADCEMQNLSTLEISVENKHTIAIWYANYFLSFLDKKFSLNFCMKIRRTPYKMPLTRTVTEKNWRKSVNASRK